MREQWNVEPVWICAALGALMILAAIGQSYFATPDNKWWSMNDLWSYFIPSSQYWRSSLRAGHIPLWNPYQLAGTPFLAMHQTQVLYPPNFLFLWAPTGAAMTMSAVFHGIIAGVGTTRLARFLGMGLPGAIALTVGYVAAPWFNRTLYDNFAYFDLAAWLPLMIALCAVHAREPSRRTFAGLALVVAMSFLTGYAQGFLYAVGLSFGFGLLVAMGRDSWKNAARSVAALVAALSLGIAISAAQFLPTMEQAALAVRDLSGVSIERASMQAVEPSKLFSFLFARSGLALSVSWLVLPLAVIGLVEKRHRKATAASLVAMLAVVDYLRGTEGFLFPFIYNYVPAGKLFRLPFRIAFIYAFLAAVICALGVDALATVDRLSRRARAVAVVLVIFGLYADLYAKCLAPRYFPPFLIDDTPYSPEGIVETSVARDGQSRTVVMNASARFPAKVGQMYGFPAVPDYDPFLPRAYAEILGVPTGLVWHGQMAVGQTREYAGGAPYVTRKLLDLFSVRYYADLLPMFLLRPRPASINSQAPRARAIVERSQALPRAYLVHDVVQASSREDALGMTIEQRFDPRSSAVVESEPLALESVAKDVAPWEWTDIGEITPNRVSLRAWCATKCLLVLTDFASPGWRAYVNGNQTEIIPTNYLFRGVPLPPGEHRVEFVYFPRSFAVGSVVSILSLLIAAVCYVLGSRYRVGRARAVGKLPASPGPRPVTGRPKPK